MELTLRFHCCNHIYSYPGCRIDLGRSAVSASDIVISMIATMVAVATPLTLGVFVLASSASVLAW